MNDRQYYSLEALLRSPKNGKGWFAYQEVKAEEAQRIEEMTGLSVLGYIHAIDRDGINHILNMHGEESQKDSIPIIYEDFFRICPIIQEYDSIHYAGITGIGRSAILFKKKKNEYVYSLIEEVWPGQKKLVLKTMYKNWVVSEMPDIPRIPGSTS